MINIHSGIGKGKAEDWTEILQVLEGTSIRVQEALLPTLTEIGKHVVQRARENAPLLRGPLREKLRLNPARIARGKLVVNVQDATPYALKQHEELTPAGPLQLGPISSQLPGTPEGGVGGKFVQRVVQYHLATYDKMLKDAFKRAIGRKERKKGS